MKNSCFRTTVSSLQKRNIIRIQRQKLGYSARLTPDITRGDFNKIGGDRKNSKNITAPEKIETGDPLAPSGFVCYV